MNDENRCGKKLGGKIPDRGTRKDKSYVGGMISMCSLGREKMPV